MCTNNCIHLIVKSLDITTLWCFLPILGPLLVQGFILERGPTIFKLFKNTICKGACTLKCTEKCFIQWWAKWRLSTYDLNPWGEGHGVQGQICDILRPQLAINRFCPSGHTDSHTLDTYIWGERAWGALILDRCRAFDLFASVDAHLWFHPFYPPPFSPCNLSPIKNLKEALTMSTGMYCNIRLLEIMRL